MKKKLFLVSLLTFVLSTVQAENLQFTLHSGEYTIEEIKDGQHIKMEGFGNLLVPGKPMLPAKTFMIALPPGATIQSVHISGAGSELSGTFDIIPAPPCLPMNDDREMVMRLMDEYYENYETTYSSDEQYPEKAGRYAGRGGLRKYTLARVSFFPFLYRPQSKRLIYTPSVTVSIDYSMPLPGSEEAKRAEKLRNDTAADDIASEFIINYEQARVWYTPEKEMLQPYDYVIITTSACSSAVTPLVTWKQNIGYNVKIVTDTWINANYTGDDLPQTVRNFLRDKYPIAAWGIEYVLIVSDSLDIPMRHCYPDTLNYGTDEAYCPPTDYYYADLTDHDTLSWDSDMDGWYGEWGHDSVDFIPEVHVGRIPWSINDTITKICNKLVAFESNTGSWKSNALLAGAISNYYDENYSGWDRTCGHTLMEEMITDMLTGWSYTTMYEKSGRDSCTVPCDFPLTNANFINTWQSGQFGVVNWWAHGSNTAAWRKYWSTDDGDNVPEDPEMTWLSFVSTADVTSLNDSFPSIIFACSCNNGWPEVANLGRALIRQGSSGIVASTRVSWYSIGWLNETWGGNASLDYYFYDYIINAGQKVGEALSNSKIFYYTNFFWPSWGYACAQNMFDFCLYGDPALVREGIAPADTPDIYVTPDSLVFDMSTKGKYSENNSDTRDGRSFSEKALLLPWCELREYGHSPGKTFKEIADTLMPNLTSPFYYWVASYRVEYEATQFTPANPCSIMQIWHGVASPVDLSSKECSMFVWNDASGVPGTPLFSERVTASVDSANYIYWNIYTLPSPIYVTGTFWVGNFEWDTLFPTSVFDTIPNLPNMYNDGSGWVPDNVDYFHAAVVSYISIADSSVMWVHNDSSATGVLNVSNITVKHGSPWITSIHPTSFSVPVGDSQLVWVVIDTSAVAKATIYRDTLLIASNDPDENPYEEPVILLMPEVGIREDEYLTNITPKVTSLLQNFPNPFHSSTVIRFTLSSNDVQITKNASLKIYDASGRLVRTLPINLCHPCSSVYSVIWDGRDNFGKKVPSGIYFYRLQTEKTNLTKKLILLK